MKTIHDIENEIDLADRSICASTLEAGDHLDSTSSQMGDSLSISVVVPTYNRSRIVLAGIESVLAQTHPAFEIIVVDDGSSDGTREMLQRFIDQRSGYGNAAPQIRYFYQSNQGQSAARNKGIAEARGEWIAFMDSDDPWHPEKLELQARAITQFKNECGACFTDATLINNLTLNTTALQTTNERFEQPFGILSDPALRLTKTFGTCWVQTFVIRTDLIRQIGGFDRDLHFAEDQDFLFRLALGTKFCYVNKPLVSIDRTDVHSDPNVAPRPWDKLEVRLQGAQYMNEKWLKLDAALPSNVRKSSRRRLRAIHSAWANLFLEKEEYGKACRAISMALAYGITPVLIAKWMLVWVTPKVARRYAPKSESFFPT
jgi:glycosyltransferase involved in cell wall biosynthesis